MNGVEKVIFGQTTCVKIAVSMGENMFCGGNNYKYSGVKGIRAWEKLFVIVVVGIESFISNPSFCHIHILSTFANTY
jgi:hypothetical protein